MTSVSVETVQYRLSEYASGLPGTELSRYMDKFKLLGIDDPYIIPKAMWKGKSDFKNLIPPTKGHHITLYCILPTSTEQF